MRAAASTPFLWLLALALPAIALVAGFPSHPRILAVLNNAGHMPVFGALAFVIHGILTRQTRWDMRVVRVVTFLSTIAAGTAIELCQPLVGRETELRDIWTDALGAVAGLALVEVVKAGRNRTATVVLVLAVAGATWPIAEAAIGYLERNRQAPALLEITSLFDWFFISTHGLQTQQSELPAAWRKTTDPKSIRIQVEREPWRVLTLTEPIPDWRPYDRLLIDLTNPEPHALQLRFRVHDQSHNNAYADRFNRGIIVPANTRMVIEIPMDEIATTPSGRRLDLSRIAGIMLFTSGKPEIAGKSFYLTRVWLEPEGR
jgi:hypothetical protein